MQPAVTQLYQHVVLIKSGDSQVNACMVKAVLKINAEISSELGGNTIYDYHNASNWYIQEKVTSAQIIDLPLSFLSYLASFCYRVTISTY